MDENQTPDSEIEENNQALVHKTIEAPVVNLIGDQFFKILQILSRPGDLPHYQKEELNTLIKELSYDVADLQRQRSALLRE